ncbi:hypothetical protein Tco_0804545 [Tanacetum coccineum]|uniref:Uncharacterized protein n=1 Tax=Tanacetum coccineum TaxID=301880 RepID=A0ABQ5A5M3_9ASTR
MEDPEQAFVEYASSRTDEAGEQYNSLSDLEKEHAKSVYLRNEEDKRRGVEYATNQWHVGQNGTCNVGAESRGCVGLYKICWGTLLVWLEFDSMDLIVEKRQDIKGVKEIYLEFKDVSHDFYSDEDVFGLDLGGVALHPGSEVYKKLGGQEGEEVFRIMDAADLVWMTVSENEAHLAVRSLCIQFPKMINNESVCL